MPTIIAELKQQHKVLAEELELIRKLGVATSDGQKKLATVKTALMNHLKIEDEKLYPALRKAAERDKKLKSLLNTFALDMEGVTQTALDFFNKYSNVENVSSAAFAMDFGNIMGALKVRIQREENMLYKEFEKIDA